ncbi:MAG: DUF3822 family protein [Muribaculaceae bacterium]|nr:DUF3822 family protein [Muribaculaceae bacterium]MDE6118318.1 DUF3822 family protein [Muribaculaceae bacterium]
MTDPSVDTSYWRLWLRIGVGRLMALMTGPESVERSVRFHSVELPAAKSPLMALEESIYATPMLPADFASVTVIVDTPDFALMPARLSVPAFESSVRVMVPDAVGEIIATAPFGVPADVALGMVCPVDQVNFLRRTFANPGFTHPLRAVAEYLSHVNASGNPRRAWAVLTADTLLMVCFSESGICFANRWTTEGSASNAAYYILAALPADCPLMIGGPAELRNAVAEILRPYVDPVMPLTLSENLLYLLGAAPDAPLDMLMQTQLS